MLKKWRESKALHLFACIDAKAWSLRPIESKHKIGGEFSKNDAKTHCCCWNQHTECDFLVKRQCNNFWELRNMSIFFILRFQVTWNRDKDSKASTWCWFPPRWCPTTMCLPKPPQKNKSFQWNSTLDVCEEKTTCHTKFSFETKRWQVAPS